MVKPFDPLMPRIQAIRPVGGTGLSVTWAGGRTATVDLGDWLRSRGRDWAALLEPRHFAAAEILYDGTGLAWPADPRFTVDAYSLFLQSEVQDIRRRPYQGEVRQVA